MEARLRPHRRDAAVIVDPAATDSAAPIVSIKHFLFRLLGKDPEAVVVSFLAGPPSQARAMLEEVMRLVPDRKHYAVTQDPPAPVPGVTFVWPFDLPGPLRRKRIGLAPTLLHGGEEYASIRRLAWKMAPGRVLGYNARLERHHLHWRSPVASMLFARGVPLDRIFLKPSWIAPFKQDRSVYDSACRIVEGTTPAMQKPAVAIVSPYFPYPLSHGGAVRIYNLLTRASPDFNIHLFSFLELGNEAAIEVMKPFVRRMYLVHNTRYREPRWATIEPPEVPEFHSKPLMEALAKARREVPIKLVQAEYTQMATYRPDILVEHDVTFDLQHQMWQRSKTQSAQWNWWRWERFEKQALRHAKVVVVMSERDRELLANTIEKPAMVLPNGVDLDRFQPSPESEGQTALFIGSFRHEPNRVAYRWLREEVWPLVVAELPAAKLVVVAGPDPELHGPDLPFPASGEIRHGFVEDVRPLYNQANLVLVPTLQSAGTNLKVLEAMAMQRAVLSTPSGCQGIGLEHGRDVWIEHQAEAFAKACVRLLQAPGERIRLATAARQLAEERYGWDSIAEEQKRLWNQMLGS
jgi:polysaccharide biosynthesis protein PslH